MSKMKKYLLTGISYVLVAALAIGGTFAYLQDSDEDVNVMTLGNVQIEQHEYERVVENGAYKTDTIDGVTSYVLKGFTQAKPLYPIVGDPNEPGNSPAYAGYDDIIVRMTQVDSYGKMQVFAGKNAQDKFVTVENTGKTDAYVRTLVALELGNLDAAKFDKVVRISSRSTTTENDFQQPWFKKTVGVIEVNGNNYVLVEYIYHGAQTSSGMKHANGILPAGDTTYPSLCQVYLKHNATNEDMVALDGNGNGTYDIMVLSQAVQAAGFENAKTALDTAFGASATEAADWFGGMRVPTDGTLPDNANAEYDGTTYEDIYAAVAAANANGGGEINLLGSATLDKPVEIAADITINGANSKYSREGSKARAAVYAGELFKVADGATLELKDIVVDGGAVWTGEVDEHLLRGTVNSGATATGALVTAGKNSKIILGEGAVLQNNDGANAVNLGIRIGATLTLNGGEIINNSSAAGAIYGGGSIVVNSGKINGNYGGIGGAIRVVTNVGVVLTMNGGEMNHNVSGDVGGAIWAGSSKSNNTYVLNGGEMAYNYSPVAGGAMYAGYYETVKIGGNFKMHHNSAPSYGAIRFHNHASLVMTGGEIYENGDNSLFLYNNSASITGGKIVDSFGYGGGLDLTWGEAEVDGVVAFNLGTNHNTAYLAETFGTLKFTVNENATNFAQFNFKPAAGYTYTAGDEAKLICMNEGYETYWDAATSTFRLQAK